MLVLFLYSNVCLADFEDLLEKRVMEKLIYLEIYQVQSTVKRKPNLQEEFFTPVKARNSSCLLLNGRKAIS